MVRIGSWSVICLAAMCAVDRPASAAIVVVSYTGITSSGEGAYLREQDFRAGTTTYRRGPVYDDAVSGSFTIDTARLPAYDPDQFDLGFYAFVTAAPDASFASAAFTSSGNIPTPFLDSRAALTFPRSGADYGELIVGKDDLVDTNEVIGVGNGTVTVRQTVGSEYWNHGLFWDNPLPMIAVDGVLLPDFSQIVGGAFGSYRHRNRYVADEVYQGSPDGQILTRTVREWTRATDQSAGVITGITMRISGVPEPATWMMMLGGFALVGVAARRRRATA